MRLGFLLIAGCALRDDDFDLDGWSAIEGDCDDLDASIHPGGLDVPGDGVDQDCDGAEVLDMVRGVAHLCELDEEHVVTCEGDNDHHQLDVPDHTAEFIAIAAGDYHTCALDRIGFVACWGDNTYGQSDAPRGGGFVSIAAGGNWSMAPREEGQVECWGQCMVRPGI
jgi:hypothetical protein